MYKQFDKIFTDIKDSELPGSTIEELRVKNSCVFVAPLRVNQEMNFGVYNVIWSANSSGTLRPSVYHIASLYSIKEAKIFAAVMSEIL